MTRITRMNAGRALLCAWLFGASLLPMDVRGEGTPVDDLEQACARVAKKLTACTSVEGKTMTVRPFAGADGQRTLLGIRLQDLLIHALSGAENKTYRVVERVRLSELDTEQGLYGDSTVDLDQWAKALKADLVILGTYALEPRRLVLTCRLVSPATGDCVTSATARAGKTQLIERWATTPAPLTPMKMAMETIGSGTEGQKDAGRSRVGLFRMKGNKMEGFLSGKVIQVHVGDSVGFSVRPAMDCRLYVLNYDPQSLEDLAIFLYPLPHAQLLPKVFEGGKTYFFPRDVDPRAVTYPVDPPYGRMVFKVIGVEAGSSQVDLTQGLDSSHGYYELNKEGLKALTARLRALPDAAWWEEGLEYWITAKP